MIWTKSGATAMRCEPWTVAKITLSGGVSYELWHDKKPAAVGRYPSFEMAKTAAEKVVL